MQTQRFDIQGASCQGCVRKIRQALDPVAGVDDVQVDLDAQQVTVTGTADSAEVQAALAKADDFNRDFQNMVTEYCWGGSWGRGVLTKQQRSMLNLGMLAALNRPHEFKLHFLGALTNGVGIDEIREVLIQIAIYCGVPAGVEAFRIAREVFQEEGIDVSRMDSKGADE